MGRTSDSSLGAGGGGWPTGISGEASLSDGGSDCMHHKQAGLSGVPRSHWVADDLVQLHTHTHVTCAANSQTHIRETVERTNNKHTVSDQLNNTLAKLCKVISIVRHTVLNM